MSTALATHADVLPLLTLPEERFWQTLDCWNCPAQPGNAGIKVSSFSWYRPRRSFVLVRDLSTCDACHQLTIDALHAEVQDAPHLVRSMFRFQHTHRGFAWRDECEVRP